MKNETIERHAASDRQVWAGDYFDTAATELDLLQQKLASPRDRRRRTGDLVRTTIELLQQTRDDLRYLQIRSLHGEPAGRVSPSYPQVCAGLCIFL